MSLNRIIGCDINNLLTYRNPIKAHTDIKAVNDSVTLKEIIHYDDYANNRQLGASIDSVSYRQSHSGNGLTNNSITKNRHNSNKPVHLSFQLMTRAEPVQMVIDTIDSLLAMKTDGDEILIIDNNHTETALYEPLVRYCAGLDTRFKVRFYHVDAVAGFKSVALNLALELMDPSCTHMVVVDSDYQALSHARASIAAAISRYPAHALLQFPQFYRDVGLADVHSELNHYFNHHLYRPFNRTHALSMGTYAVIRRDAH